MKLPFIFILKHIASHYRVSTVLRFLNTVIICIIIQVTSFVKVKNFKKIKHSYCCL